MPEQAAMPLDAQDPSEGLPCARCGYDLRAHPRAGRCPECEAPVADAIALAAVPLHPRWHERDPRWRRRLLAGLWTLSLLPLVAAALTLQWIRHIPAPGVFDYRGTVTTLDHTLFAYGFFSLPLIGFCGLVLLFARERRVRPHPLDWTRRWGLLLCCMMAILLAAELLFIPGLVLIGISALFISIPPEFAPPVTRLFAEISYVWIRFGPQPSRGSSLLLAAVTSAVVLLACARLYLALRGMLGPRSAAAMLLPLALFAVLYLGLLLLDVTRVIGIAADDLFLFTHYFAPEPLVRQWAGRSPTVSPINPLLWPHLEAVKWAAILAVTLTLTAGQFRASFRRSVVRTTQPAQGDPGRR